MAAYEITNFDTERIKVEDTDTGAIDYIKKPYLTLSTDGDYVQLFWHEFETARDRKFLAIDYNDITSFTASDADDAVLRVKALTTIANNYKVYSALFTQTGTNDPVPTILDNTFGDPIVWSYADVGSYYGTLTGAFIENKVMCPEDSTRCISSFDLSLYGVFMVRVNDDVINLVTTNDIGDLINDMLYNKYIEIRVYN